MNIEQEKIKLQNLILECGLKNVGPYSPEPNRGDRYRIKGEESKDTLWIQIQQQKIVVSLSGDKQNNEHKEIYDYVGRGYDNINSQNKQWFFYTFNEVKNIIYKYAGVKKENMEQEFRQWLKEQKTQHGNPLTKNNHITPYCKTLRKVIPSWNGVKYDNLFNIADSSIINNIYSRCHNNGDLCVLNQDYNNGLASNALKWYQKFLEPRNIFIWVKWFGELAEIVSNKDQDIFAGLINQVVENKENSIVRFEAYDPFSFFYFLAQKNTKYKKRLFFQGVDKVFNVSTPLPDFDNDNCWVFPTPTPHSNVLYRWNSKYEPELLWDFFQQIIPIKNVDELSQKIADDEFINDFQSVLNLTSVGVPKLTQTLFLINPNVFFTIDWILKPISNKLLDSPNTDAEKNIKQLKRDIETEGFSAYFKIMQKIHTLFPDKTPYEINYQLWLDAEKGENMTNDELQEKINLLKNKKQIILQGSPGTGKTRQAKEIAYYLITNDFLSDDKVEREKQLKKIIKKNESEILEMSIDEIYNIGLQFINVGDEFLTISQSREFTISKIDDEKIYVQNSENNTDISVGKDRIKSYIKDKNYNETYGHYSYHQPIARFINEIVSNYNQIVFLKDKDIITENKQKLKIEKIDIKEKKVYFQYQYDNKWSSSIYYLPLNNNCEIYWNKKKESEKYFNAIKEVIKNNKKRQNLIDQSKQYQLIQFHPAYSYEDFVRGIVATTDDKGNIGYEVKNKVLTEMAENAFASPNEKFVLIIDEINRANLPAVLGELIYALEYRDEPVESMYAIKDENNKESRQIILPENLYIIGTMNTADRSVGHIDYAIRRRFAFVDVPTDRKVIEQNKPDNLELFDKVKGLFKNHLSEEFDKDDVMIGHSYFLNDDLAMAWKYEIKPILYEYVKDGVLTCEKSEIDDLYAI